MTNYNISRKLNKIIGSLDLPCLTLVSINKRKYIVLDFGATSVTTYNENFPDYIAGFYINFSLIPFKYTN